MTGGKTDRPPAPRSSGTTSATRTSASSRSSGTSRTSGHQRSGQQRSATSRARSSSVAAARRRKPVVKQRQVPWMLIGALAVIVVLVGILAFSLMSKKSANDARDSVLAPWRPTAENKDPSLKIPGIVTANYQGQHHIAAPVRVRYDHSPPFGGPHDQYWPACMGAVYPNPVRTENMVHGLEHGAVWIAYDPTRISGPALGTLVTKVQGQPYMMISPYPGLDQPISLQSWGHQLKLTDVADPRIDQFVAALRQNPNTYPEVNASCDALGPGAFDQNNPPPFVSTPYPPLGKGSVSMNYQGDLNGTTPEPAATPPGRSSSSSSSSSSKSSSSSSSRSSGRSSSSGSSGSSSSGSSSSSEH